MQSSYQKRIRFLCSAAIIAALYVVFTLISSMIGLSSGVIQLRISEALIAAVAFTPAAIPGLFVGCIIANILTGAVLWDIVFGSLATLIGALGGWLLRKNKWLLTIPTIVANAVIIPFILRYAYGAEGALPFFILTVGIGEIISSGVFGILLYHLFKKYEKHLF